MSSFGTDSWVCSVVYCLMQLRYPCWRAVWGRRDSISLPAIATASFFPRCAQLRGQTIRIQHGSFSLQKTSNVFGCASLRLLATLASSVPRLSLVGSAFPDPPSLLSVCCCQALGDVTLAKFYRACEGGGAAYGLVFGWVDERLRIATVLGARCQLVRYGMKPGVGGPPRHTRQ